jgi:hypothetical protein
MDSKNSFTYVISSDERTNDAVNQITYNIDFGGFSEMTQDYHCEVLSFSMNGKITATPAPIGYFMFMCENLNDDGFFMVKKISNRDCLISIVPLTATIDAHHQYNGEGGISFKVNNCQMRRPIKFKWLKPDFTEVISGTDINVGGEKKWVLVLKMTPIE